MGEQKKSSKAGRSSGSKSAASYKAEGRRYRNKIKKVKKHIKRTGDQTAQRWLEGASKIFSADYQRGAPAVKKLHDSIYN